MNFPVVQWELAAGLRDAPGGAGDIHQRVEGKPLRNLHRLRPHQLHLRIVIHQQGLFSLFPQHYQQIDIHQRMIQPPAGNAYQQKFVEPPAHGLLGRKHRVRIILLHRQNDGLPVSLRLFMGIEVPHDQIRLRSQRLLMSQAAVAVNEKIVRPEILPHPVIGPDLRTADDHASSHIYHILFRYHTPFFAGPQSFCG